MSKQTIIHLFLRILLVPAIPFFVTAYVFNLLEDGRHGMKYILAMFVASIFTALYLFIESMVFFIKDDYKSFKLNVILLTIIALWFMVKVFSSIKVFL